MAGGNGEGEGGEIGGDAFQKYFARITVFQCACGMQKVLRLYCVGNYAPQLRWRCLPR